MEKNINDLVIPFFSSALGLGFVSIIMAVAILCLANRYRHVWNFFSRHLMAMFCVVWLFGFVVYDVGMLTEKSLCLNHVRDLLWNVPMAMLYAFGMFILESDVSAIHEAFFYDTFFMACFSLAHFLAALVSMVFVIKHFGYNVIAGLRLFFAAYSLRKKDITYVFWGMNNATYHLASSIKTHHQGDKTSRTIVVRTNSDGDTTSVRNGMERLFNFLSLKNKDLNRLLELECLTTSMFVDLATMSVTKDADGCGDILRKTLGMRLLCRIMRRKTTRELHVFFLSDDEEANIKSVAQLRSDRTLLQFVEEGAAAGRKVILYCHTRNNSIHRVIEDEQLRPEVMVKVVDSSRLCVDLLKRAAELHPVNYVEIEDDATVSSSFNSLVVGFGQVGLDVVRFLYEFGAFVKSGGTSQHVERSDFHCNVVDKDMPELAGLFVANAPAIRPALPFKDQEAKDSLLRLHQMDCRSVFFYEHLEEWVKTLNYVVLATGDDELNISLGVRILRLAIRYRTNMDHFHILVRVSRDEDGHIRSIAHFYNRLWEAETKKDREESLERQKIVPSDAKPESPISLFGALKDTYQYDLIVSGQLEELAKKVKVRYDESIRVLEGSENRVKSWDEEYREYMQLAGEYAGYSPTYSNVMRLRRMQSQNYENCFHILTKQRLAKCALGADEFTTLTSHQLYRKNNEVTYQWKSNTQPKEKVTRVLDTLARTEHLRWNASHEILGYQHQGDESFKDEAKLLHGCLKDWHELSERVRSYDYNVVDVSLGIIELEQQKEQ